MFYKLTSDMDLVDESIRRNDPYIYAETCNVDEVEIPGIKKGHFDKVIYHIFDSDEWPEIVFFYSSIASKKESDYLVNIKGWPIIHRRVQNEFEKNNIEGTKFFPINLEDVCTGQINKNYSLMYVENFIDAFDMIKSQYKHNEKYNMYTFIPRKTYLNQEICKRYDIFRAEKSPAGLFVSHKIYEIVKDNGFVGFYFDEQP